jgi:hypothetical protein
MIAKDRFGACRFERILASDITRRHDAKSVEKAPALTTIGDAITVRALAEAATSLARCGSGNMTS